MIHTVDSAVPYIAVFISGVLFSIHERVSCNVETVVPYCSY